MELILLILAILTLATAVGVLFVVLGQRAAVRRELTSFQQTMGTQLLQTTQAVAGMDTRLAALRDETDKKLTEMRALVDEKLQKVLEERLAKSFSLVQEQLTLVHRGLGEMQTLAAGVGDLKKVLSNVKTRGILGEIQLGAILDEILPRAQYETNIATKPGSACRVEYAVKLPGDDYGKPVWLPIDAKFPVDPYHDLLDAYDAGDKERVDNARRVLVQTVKSFARDIRDKYISPPDTTDFALMFLPIEGLYAEAVQCGLLETLQHEYQVSLTGPATMAAFLNTLQMGFKTLAFQKRSGEIRQLLSAVKTEFLKFAEGLSKTQERLRQADHELEALVGTRTNAIQRRLREVEALPEEEAAALLSE